MIQLLALFYACMILWAAGSILVALFKPWRHFTGPDLWIAWTLVFAWPLVCVAMAVELAIENRDPEDGRGG